VLSSGPVDDGRTILPLVAGAVPVAVDEGSVRDIPGVQIVRDKGFLGIFAAREWDAVQAAERIAVTWSEAAPPLHENAVLYQHIRQAPVVKREVPGATGEVDQAFAGAARVVEAEYEWTFQSGKVWARKFTVAHDRGLIINPDGLRRGIEGNVVQGTRAAPCSGRSPLTAPRSPALTGRATRSSTSPRRSMSCC